MSFWTEVHWQEGMFLRPHHMQAGQRYLETNIRTGMDAIRPFGWGFVDLQFGAAQLENHVLRLDKCLVRLKESGTWLCVPDNADVEPLNFKGALEEHYKRREHKELVDDAKDQQRGLDIYLGVPNLQPVRANAVPTEGGEDETGLRRYQPRHWKLRDENTGQNEQRIYVRRLRARLFTALDDMAGFETVRVGAVYRTTRPGAVPDLDELGAGPLLALQANVPLSALMTALCDQVESKNEVLAKEAREHHMSFADGYGENSQHLLKLHALNEARAHFRALLQCPLLHPFDVYLVLARLIGHLSIFDQSLTPGLIVSYDHDRPGRALDRLRERVEYLLDAMHLGGYESRAFTRKRDPKLNEDGLEVELDREWISKGLDLWVGFDAPNMETPEFERHLKTQFVLKLASPTRAPTIRNLAVRGLSFVLRPVPPGTLPRTAGKHYFKIDKHLAAVAPGPGGGTAPAGYAPLTSPAVAGGANVNYWKECEDERGIRMSIKAEQMAAMEKFKPTLYVIVKRQKAS